MPNYQVEGCRILKTEMERVFALPNCERIILGLALQGSSFLDLNVFAADSANNPLPGATVSWTPQQARTVRIDNPFDPASANSIITAAMIQVLSFTTLELDGKKFKPRHNKPPHGDREFVGWKAKFKD